MTRPVAAGRVGKNKPAAVPGVGTHVEVDYPNDGGLWPGTVFWTDGRGIAYVLFVDGIHPVDTHQYGPLRVVHHNKATCEALAGVLAPGAVLKFAMATEPTKDVFGEVANVRVAVNEVTLHLLDGRQLEVDVVAEHTDWMSATPLETSRYYLAKGKQLAYQALDSYTSSEGGGGGGSSDTQQGGPGLGLGGTQQEGQHDGGTQQEGQHDGGTQQGGRHDGGTQQGGRHDGGPAMVWIKAYAAFTAALKALERADTSLSTKAVKRAAHHEAARAVWHLKRVEEAVAHLKAAIELSNAAANAATPGGGDSMRTATLQLQLGFAFYKQGKKNADALEMLTQGADALARILESDRAKFEAHVAKARYGGAKGCTSHPSHLSYLVRVCGKVHVKLRRNELAQARRYFELALKILEIGSTGDRSDLAKAALCDELAYVSHKEGKYQEALDLRVKAADIKRQLLGINLETDLKVSDRMERALKRVERAQDALRSAAQDALRGAAKRKADETAGSSARFKLNDSEGGSAHGDVGDSNGACVTHV